MCYMEPDCVSINVRPSYGGKYKCELNNATADVDQLNVVQEVADSYYRAIEVNKHFSHQIGAYYLFLSFFFFFLRAN